MDARSSPRHCLEWLGNYMPLGKYRKGLLKTINPFKPPLVALQTLSLGEGLFPLAYQPSENRFSVADRLIRSHKIEHRPCMWNEEFAEVKGTLHRLLRYCRQGFTMLDDMEQSGDS